MMQAKPNRTHIATLALFGLLAVTLTVPGVAQEGGGRRGPAGGPAAASKAKKPAGKAIAIAAARVETITNGPIRDGVIIIRDGKIAEVGRALPIPDGAELIDLGSGTVLPGLVVPVSSLGIASGGPQIPPQFRGRFRPPSQGSAMGANPHLRAYDALNALESTYERLLAGGVTTINLAPQGNGIAGQSTAIRAARGHRDDVTLEEFSALFGGTFPSSAAKGVLQGELEKGKRAIEARQKKKQADAQKGGAGGGQAQPPAGRGGRGGRGGHDARSPEAPDDGGKTGDADGKGDEKEEEKADPRIQPLIDVLEGRKTLVLDCSTPAAAAHLFPMIEPYTSKPWSTRLALLGGSEIWLAKELLAEKGVAVILPASLSSLRNTNKRLCVPAILRGAGIEVALQPASDSTAGGETYLLQAARLIKHGMRREDVLRAMTHTPAKILGLDGRLGSVEPGKDANLVLLDGDPFLATTRIIKVLLEGEVVHEDGRRPSADLTGRAAARDASGSEAASASSRGKAPERKAPVSDKGAQPAGEEEAKAGKKDGDAGKKADVVAIVGGDIYTVARGVVRKGTVLVRDGKIAEVGVDVEVPKDARVIDAKGKIVTPGFVAANLSGAGMDFRGINAGKLVDCLDPWAFSVTLALSSGITTAYVTGGAGGSGLIRGTSAVVKMTEGDLDRMMVQEPAAASIQFTGSPASAKQDFKRQLREAAEYARKVEEAQRLGKEGKPPPKDPRLEALLPILRGDIPARIFADATDDILDALELVDEFGIRLVLDGGMEAWAVAGEISKRDVTMVLAPRRKQAPDPSIDRPNGSNVLAPGILQKAGVPFAILAPSSSMSTGGIAGQDMITLPIDAAFAVGRGMDEDAALEAITLEAARAIGVESRVGSIEPGKDADILVLDGHPLDFRTFVEMAMIEGKVYYEKSKNPLFAPFGRNGVKPEGTAPGAE